MTVCESKALREGDGVKFQFKRDGVRFEGFVVRVGGALHAYVNQCRHQPLPLDYGDGRFFTPDGNHLVCSTHGALYEPATGNCVQGPCAGASLKRLPVEESADGVCVTVEDS